MLRLPSAAILIFALCLGSAEAADGAPGALKPYSFVSEARVGISAHDVDGVEREPLALTGEILFAKPIQSADPLLSFLVPHFHLGASLNVGGDTSFAYAGFTWSADLTSQLFVELAFGGAFHNGETGATVPVGRAALGCSPLFREAAAIGWRFSPNWNVSIGIEHVSNGGLCDRNRGLTNAGIKLGYTF